MSESRLERLRKAEAEATAGPWDTLTLSRPPATEIRRPVRDMAATPVGRAWGKEDAALIVEARNALPALLDVVEAAQEVLRAEQAMYQALARHAQGGIDERGLKHHEEDLAREHLREALARLHASDHVGEMSASGEGQSRD